MSTFFGVDSTGFKNRRQADWETDLKAAMLSQFGATVNLSANTYLGQLASIMAERLALVSEAVADTYSAQDPAAAEGVAIDYQLALLGLTRLTQRPTVTNPVPDTTAQGLVLPGLVLYGTPGTRIPQGSIVQTATLPTLNFTLDADVTIAVAQNALQQLVFSQKPTAGRYTLTLVAPSGQSVTTQPLACDASAADVQAALAALVDPGTQLRPFTDVGVSQTAAQVLTVAFGQGTAERGQPASGALAQAKIIAAPSGLLAGAALVNLSVAQTTVGQPPQGTVSATCTATGPNVVLAHSLSVIGSSTSGWTAVDNPLDCLTGADTESDTDAALRRTQSLAARGTGTLAGIITKVLAVPGVTTALGFENKTQAAQQVLTFSAVPTGPFQLAIGGQTTGPIAAPPTASALQAAINACAGLDAVKVTGAPAYGFTLDFNGAQGGQAQPLVAVVNDQTGVTVAPGFGRPPKSFEIVAQGGQDTDVAQAILDAAPAGVACYGTPTLRTTGSCTAGATDVTLASVSGLAIGQNLSGAGLPQGALVAAINGLRVTLTLAALGTATQVPMVGQAALQLLDAQGNPHLVAFSRPQPVVLYVQAQLVTDYYNVPGDPASGQNPNATFDPAALLTVQQSLIQAAQAVPIGGRVVARGTSGLASAFRDVPGVQDATVAFDSTPEPTNTDNLDLLPEQILSVQAQYVSVAFS